MPVWKTSSAFANPPPRFRQGTGFHKKLVLSLPTQAKSPRSFQRPGALFCLGPDGTRKLCWACRGCQGRTRTSRASARRPHLLPTSHRCPRQPRGVVLDAERPHSQVLLFRRQTRLDESASSLPKMTEVEPLLHLNMNTIIYQSNHSYS
jgi:hypothetical protein